MDIKEIEVANIVKNSLPKNNQLNIKEETAQNKKPGITLEISDEAISKLNKNSKNLSVTIEISNKEQKPSLLQKAVNIYKTVGDFIK